MRDGTWEIRYLYPGRSPGASNGRGPWVETRKERARRRPRRRPSRTPGSLQGGPGEPQRAKEGAEWDSHWETHREANQEAQEPPEDGADRARVPGLQVSDLDIQPRRGQVGYTGRGAPPVCPCPGGRARGSPPHDRRGPGGDEESREVEGCLTRDASAKGVGRDTG